MWTYDSNCSSKDTLNQSHTYRFWQLNNTVSLLSHWRCSVKLRTDSEVPNVIKAARQWTIPYMINIPTALP
jgi:hypothetical protein